MPTKSQAQATAPATAGASVAPPAATEQPRGNAAAQEGVSGSVAGGGALEEAAAAAPPPFTGPQTQAAYVAHIRTRFGGEFAQMDTHLAAFAAGGGDAKRLTTKLELGGSVYDEAFAKFEKKKDSLDEAAQARARRQLVVAQAIDAGTDGKTMVVLLEDAKRLAEECQSLGRSAVAQRVELEATMQAAMRLASQIDPEGTEFGRALYVKIDEEGHTELLTEARNSSLPEAEAASLAVNYRNWLREYFRNEVMTDGNNAEILFLRDLGLRGSRGGMSEEAVMSKVIKGLQKPKEGTKDAVLRADFTKETATAEELSLIYQGMIESAMTTNDAVTDSTKKSGS